MSQSPERYPMLLLSASDQRELKPLLGNGVIWTLTDKINYAVSVHWLHNHRMAEAIPKLAKLPRCIVEFSPEGQTLVPESIADPQPATMHEMPRMEHPSHRPPLPPHGDWQEGGLYEQVGRALSAWEGLEEALQSLFVILCGPMASGEPIKRAYGSVLSFSGRKEMLLTAFRTLFLGPDESEGQVEAEQNKKENETKAKFTALLNLIGQFSGRRNEIAHGIVKEYGKFYTIDGFMENGLALLPPGQATNKTDIRLPMNDCIGPYVPRYAYTSVEIGYFTSEFEKLVSPVRELTDEIRALIQPHFEAWIEGYCRSLERRPRQTTGRTQGGPPKDSR